MYAKHLLALLLFVFGISASVQKRNTPQYLLIRACESLTEVYQWDGMSFGDEMMMDGDMTICDTWPSLATLSLCLNMYAANSDILDKAYDLALDYPCGESNSLQQLKQLAANSSLIAISSSQVTTTTSLTVPITFNLTYYHLFENSMHIHYRSYDMASMYGWVITGYWVLIIVLYAIANFLTKSGLIFKLQGAATVVFQSYFLLPATFNGNHFVPYKFLKYIPIRFPTRANALAVAGYLVIHIIALSVGWEKDEIHPLYATTSEETCRKLADRTGILAFTHFPLIFVMPGRNSIFTYFTGVSATTLLYFHKWLAALMVIDGIIHAICFSLIFTWQGQYLSHIREEPYIIWGIAAMVAGGIIMIQSYRIIRNKAYEIFLVGHILLVIAFTFSVYWHMDDWADYIYAMIAIWLFDRFARLVRIVNFGFPKALVQIVSPEDMKVTIPVEISWDGKPGQYAYVYFLLPGCFWQSHPFSVSSTTGPAGSLTIYIKRKKGVTNKLFELASKSPEKLLSNIRVALEGPYGEVAPLQQFDNVVLFAAGDCIAGPLDHAVTLSRKYPYGQKNIIFNWISKDVDSIKHFEREIHALSHSTGQFTLHLTRLQEQGDNDDSTISTEEKEKNTVPNETALLKNLKVKFGRPDIPELIKANLSDLSGSIAVYSCGTPSVSDTVRRSVVNNLHLHRERVEYFEEYESW